MQTKKQALLRLINEVTPLSDYNATDCIFSQKYSILPVDIVYILLALSKQYGINIDDDFVDSLEAATFAQLEDLCA